MSEGFMDYIEKLQIELNEADEFLESVLLSKDLDRLTSIKQELSHHIEWKKIVSNTFSVLLLSLESTVFEGEEGSKQGNIPHSQLLLADQEFLEGNGNLRKNYVILQLLKKLLGALKTRTKQTIADVPTLDEDKEKQVRKFILDGERELLLEDIDFDSQNADEEEMDLITPNNPEIMETWGSTRAIEKKKGIELQITTDLKRPDSSTNCRHISTTTSYPQKDGNSYIREFCRHCHQVIRYQPWDRPSSTTRKKRQHKVFCNHRLVAWVEGEEGKIAVCMNCNLTPIPKPENYTWEKSGLEPFGDSPSEDKVESLDKLMSCES